MSALAASLRAGAPWRVLDGYGRAVLAACRYVAPQTVEELLDVLAHARGEGLSVTFRGAGRSYGDAAVNTHGLVVDTCRLNRLLRWEPTSGVCEAEPGLTIEGLWRRTIADGYWPAVVPGTMFPTLGGCLSANVHGKNNYRAGPIGEHVEEFDLITARGETLRCSASENAEVFHAAIGGMGSFGALARVKIRLKRVASGRLEVAALYARDLDEVFDLFQAHLPSSDYLVGWIDGFATARQSGRGVLHAARYLKPGEDPEAEDTLRVERQGLPGHILGFPRAQAWRVMRAMTNDHGIAFVNAAKCRTARWSHNHRYLQSHAAFAFLLDYVPDWRLAYGPGGFIQYQVFVPDRSARECLRDALRLCHDHRIRPYLGVFKRHRLDRFLLSHAVDGWSLALDFRVTAATRERLKILTSVITDRVLDAGGRFYFAKDSVLTPDQ
ncbi:MAG: FAD-binding oxidoreductase, partial [Vicinamibacteria bacterium]|nr:FAD-binding oxidoreductase [Vicinamibacteria bacterium]